MFLMSLCSLRDMDKLCLLNDIKYRFEWKLFINFFPMLF